MQVELQLAHNWDNTQAPAQLQITLTMTSDGAVADYQALRLAVALKGISGGIGVPLMLPATCRDDWSAVQFPQVAVFEVWEMIL